MKEDVIDRYERAPDGGILIDVATASIENLYEDFDKSAPYIRRDPDQDFVEHRANIKLYRRLAHAPLIFRSNPALPA